MKMESLSGNFLVASPGLDDMNFGQTVVLVCDHTEDGAFGLVVNKVIMESFQALLLNFNIEAGLVDLPVYYGGPVRPEQGYIVYSPFRKKYGNLKIRRTIGVSSSRELLQDIVLGKGPEHYLFALGYSGWNANQLEGELMTDGWLVTPVDSDILFNVKPAERWRSAARLIGVDFHRYTERAGNA
ncbi:MAG: YqgE/AlgH family protein [Nitrospirota bacterium]|nr:YqgE/AlgH family protein [Nitrospirota bacterium]